jgi:phage-related protein
MAIGFTVPNINRKVIPDKTLAIASEPKVRVAQFGDGYSQRIADGINSVNQSFTVALVNREKSDADDITAFFESRKGVTSFNFTYPDTIATSTSTAVISAPVSSSANVALVSSPNLYDITTGAVVSSTGTGNNISGSPTVLSINGLALVLSSAQSISPTGKQLTFINQNEKTVKVVCSTWSMQFSNSNYYNINAEFTRVYEP